MILVSCTVLTYGYHKLLKLLQSLNKLCDITDCNLINNNNHLPPTYHLPRKDL